MRRRNKQGGKAVKTQRRKALTGRNAPKAALRRSVAATANLQDQLDRRTRELKESLEQQAATSEGRVSDF